MKQTKFDKLFEKLSKQWDSDRLKIEKAFDDLRAETNNPQDFMQNGIVLAKFAEVLVKQSSQVADFAKAIKDSEVPDKENEINEDELNNVYEILKAEEKK